MPTRGKRYLEAAKTVGDGEPHDTAGSAGAGEEGCQREVR